PAYLASTFIFSFAPKKKQIPRRAAPRNDNDLESCAIGAQNARRATPRNDNEWRFSYFGLRFEHYGRRAGDASVFADAPEMDAHENRGDQRNGNAMPNIGAKQRVGVNDGAAQ